MKNLIKLIFIFISFCNHAQTTQVSGYIIDSIKNEPMPFVKILFQNTAEGGVSDINGYFQISTQKKTDTLIFSYMGYEEKKIPIQYGKKQELTIYLFQSTNELETIEVTDDKKNPAFRILKAINDNRKYNDPSNLDAYEYEAYNKMQFNITNLGEDFAEEKDLKKINFVVDYTNKDTTNGNTYLPFLLSESISNYYYKSNPTQKKEVIIGSRVTGLQYVQVGQLTGDMYQNVNIYDNQITLFDKDFLSPIAPTGRAFYKYYLMGMDTLDETPCYHIQFKPKRKGDLLFEGDMWVTDSSFAIKKITCQIPNDVNLNYVSNFKVEQYYSLIDSTIYMVTSEKVTANFDFFNNDKPDKKLIGVSINKNTTRKNITINQAYDFDFYAATFEISDTSVNNNPEFWQEKRHVELNNEEQGVIDMIDSLKQNKTFRFYEGLTYMSYTGFWRQGPLEYGNLFSLYNRNTVEGHRVMLALRTSNKFSTKHELNAFGIYGFGDEKFKYGASYRWKIKNSPREMLRFAYKKRIEQLALSPSLGDIGNSFTTLFSQGPLDKLTLLDQASISFEKDWNINMRTFNAVEWKMFTPLGNSDYSRINEIGDTNKVLRLTSFEIRNQIMYTKEEKFFMGMFDRISLGSKYPIISLTHTFGLKGVLGGEYNFHRFDFIWDHRPRVGVLGRLHYTVYAGKILGTVPYPFLNIHAGNESFYLQTRGFNLLNYYEFISDTWVGVNFEHRLMGFVMDRIPLVRKLKLRLVYHGKALIGMYDNKHNAEMLLPDYVNQLSFTKPYAEAGIGIENIFKFMRVDAIWRLSYLDHPDIRTFGVKLTFKGDF